MQNLRQMTQKGDPMFRIQLPVALIHVLQSNAKKNKRRAQDQLIKDLVETFKHEEGFSDIFEQCLPELKKVYQQ